MNYTRTYQDLTNMNPLMKDIFYEKEAPNKNDKYNLQPRRMRTHKLDKIPVMFDEPSNAQPRFRWITSEWMFGEPDPTMKPWNEKYRAALGRMQGSM